jgi:hypothetical protein
MRLTTPRLPLLALSLSLVACGPPAPEGEYTLGACSVNLLVNEATPPLEQLKNVVDAAVATDLVTCDKLHGLILVVRPVFSWHDQYNDLEVNGLAFCGGVNSNFNRVEVGNTLPLYAGALMHELVHVNDCPRANNAHIDFPYDRVYAAQALAKKLSCKTEYNCG